MLFYIPFGVCLTVLCGVSGVLFIVCFVSSGCLLLMLVALRLVYLVSLWCLRGLWLPACCGWFDLVMIIVSLLRCLVVVVIVVIVLLVGLRLALGFCYC